MATNRIDSQSDGSACAALPGDSTALRRELGLLETAAMSIGLTAPVGAMALIGAGAAGLLGRAAPLAFVFALVGITLVAYSFVRLAGFFTSSGSSYGLVGATIGPRTGFVAGCALALTYVMFSAGSTAELGLFGGRLLKDLRLTNTADWIVISMIAAGLLAGLAAVDVKAVTRTLLGMEFLSIALVIILLVIIVVQLISGSAPHGQTVTLEVFKLPRGTSLSTVGAAAVYGFLAFAGFEGAAVLGEESQRPRRDIPRALIAAVVVVGAFLLMTITVQAMGFGTSASGTKAFAGSSFVYGDLARQYAGIGLSDVLLAASMVSIFATALGSTIGAARIVYAISRDLAGDRGTGRVSPRTGSPIAAVAVVVTVFTATTVIQRINQTNAVNATFYPLTIGVLSLLVAYFLVSVGAIRYLFIRQRRVPLWEILVPALGVCFLVYTMDKQVTDVSFPYDRFPWWVLGYLAIATAAVVLFPGLAGRLAERLGQGSAGSEHYVEAPAETKPG